MLNSEQRVELTELAGSSLDEAERVWEEVGDVLAIYERMEKLAAKAIPTLIPGYPFIREGRPKVDDFIAFMVDLRDSSKHLMQRISARTTDVTQLQRIYYETSALLPVCSKVIGYHGGKVTEYLGDGLLALFLASKDKMPSAIYAANRAAFNCIEATSEIINPLVEERYNLPQMSIGVGMALSRAIVTLVGLEEFAQPKVFGECVFYATKFSSGRDEVCIDKRLKGAWPRAADGVLSFSHRRINGHDGYVVIRKDKR